jgi:hypothetical protein
MAETDSLPAQLNFSTLQHPGERYTLEDLLGSGVYSEVLEARDRNNGKNNTIMHPEPNSVNTVLIQICLLLSQPKSVSLNLLHLESHTHTHFVKIHGNTIIKLKHIFSKYSTSAVTSMYTSVLC